MLLAVWAMRRRTFLQALEGGRSIQFGRVASSETRPGISWDEGRSWAGYLIGQNRTDRLPSVETGDNATGINCRTSK